MAWWEDLIPAAFDIGLSLFQDKKKFQAADEKADANIAWINYSNAMTDLSNSINQNAITTNEVLAVQASDLRALDISKVSIAQAAQANVVAAAAGVKGRSVNQSIFDIQRNAATADYNRVVELNNQFLAFDQQRLNSSMSARLNQNYSYVAKPSASTALLGSVSSALTPYIGDITSGISDYFKNRSKPTGGSPTSFEPIPKLATGSGAGAALLS